MRNHFVLPATYTSNSVPLPYADGSTEKPHSLPLLPPGRCRVTVVKFSGCHLCDGAVDGSFDGAVARLEVTFGAVVELLVGNHVGGELGCAEDGDLVVGRLADPEKLC